MGYPSTVQYSGQFSFNAFRGWWVNPQSGDGTYGGTDWGNHLQAWMNHQYYGNSDPSHPNVISGTPKYWPTSNMHMFLFYNVYNPNFATLLGGGGSPGGGGGK